MSQTVIINVGPSGAGKSTWSTAYIKENPNFIRINRDDIRKLLRGSLDWYYQQEGSQLRRIENYVSSLEELLFVQSLSQGFSLILDNTHLKPSYIQKWIDFVTGWNSDQTVPVEVKFKLFNETNSRELKARVAKREGIDIWNNQDKFDYIDKQVNSTRSAISYVEDNYKTQILND